MAEHISYVQNKDDTPSGKHFSGSGHSLADIKMVILEKLKRMMNYTEKIVNIISSENVILILWKNFFF